MLDLSLCIHVSSSLFWVMELYFFERESSSDVCISELGSVALSARSKAIALLYFNPAEVVYDNFFLGLR